MRPDAIDWLVTPHDASTPPTTRPATPQPAIASTWRRVIACFGFASTASVCSTAFVGLSSGALPLILVSDIFGTPPHISVSFFLRPRVPRAPLYKVRIPVAPPLHFGLDRSRNAKHYARQRNTPVPSFGGKTSSTCNFAQIPSKRVQGYRAQVRHFAATSLYRLQPQVALTCHATHDKREIWRCNNG